MVKSVDAAESPVSNYSGSQFSRERLVWTLRSSRTSEYAFGGRTAGPNRDVTVLVSLSL
jgi:hypothetical protein